MNLLDRFPKVARSFQTGTTRNLGLKDATPSWWGETPSNPICLKLAMLASLRSIVGLTESRPTAEVPAGLKWVV
jgi:hypothetical protein